MLIPQFSLRHILVLTTVCALFFYVVAMATRGNQLAIAIAITITSVFVVLAVHAMLFAVAWGLTLLGRLFTKQSIATSPFANATPPPQFIAPPEDVE
jgi:hypothetical protein